MKKTNILFKSDRDLRASFEIQNILDIKIETGTIFMFLDFVKKNDFNYWIKCLCAKGIVWFHYIGGNPKHVTDIYWFIELN